MQKVDASIIGELYLDEMPYWDVHVCRIKIDDGDVVIYSEDGHVIERIEPEMKPASDLWDDDSEVIDIESVAEKVNEVIELEHSQL